MKIKEQDEQRMVIVPSFEQRLGLVILFAYGIPIFVVLTFFNSVVSIVFAISWGIFVFVSPQGRIVVLDKLKSSISIKERRFLVTNKERLVPFDDVNKVLATEQIIYFYNVFTLSENFFSLRRQRIFHQLGTGFKVWEINLTVGEKQIKIDTTPNQSHMRDLANEISTFIKKQ